MSHLSNRSWRVPTEPELPPPPPPVQFLGLLPSQVRGATGLRTAPVKTRLARDGDLLPIKRIVRDYYYPKSLDGIYCYCFGLVYLKFGNLNQKSLVFHLFSI